MDEEKPVKGDPSLYELQFLLVILVEVAARMWGFGIDETGLYVVEWLWTTDGRCQETVLDPIRGRLVLQIFPLPNLCFVCPSKGCYFLCSFPKDS